LKKLLELKELSEEREAPKHERAQKLKEEKLSEYKDSSLLEQRYELKRKNRKLLEFYKRVEFNSRYFEEYEHFLRHKEFLREYCRQF